MGQWGNGQWVVSSNCGHAWEGRQTRARRLGSRGWFRRGLSVPPFRSQYQSRLCPSSKEKGVLGACLCDLTSRGEPVSGIASPIVWWTLNGCEMLLLMVMVVLDRQLLYWACLHTARTCRKYLRESGTAAQHKKLDNEVTPGRRRRI
jgi:hypothetical protein